MSDHAQFIADLLEGAVDGAECFCLETELTCYYCVEKALCKRIAARLRAALGGSAGVLEPVQDWIKDQQGFPHDPQHAGITLNQALSEAALRVSALEAEHKARHKTQAKLLVAALRDSEHTALVERLEGMEAKFDCTAPEESLWELRKILADEKEPTDG